jgi:hypothetical protein
MGSPSSIGSGSGSAGTSSLEGRQWEGRQPLSTTRTPAHRNVERINGTGLSGTSVTVRSKWLSRLWPLPVVTIAGGIAYVYLEQTAIPSSVSFTEMLAVLVLAGASWLALVAGLILAWYPRSCTISDMGLTLHFVRHDVTVPWKSLMRPIYPYRLGFGVGWYTGGEPPKDSTNLSREQARALPTHPACPKWNLSAEILKSVGVPVEDGASG